MKTINAALATAIAATLLVLCAPSADAGTMAPYWSKGWGDFGNDVGRSVATDAIGNVIVVGSFEGTIDLGGGNLNSAGGEDIFIAKFDRYGAHLWSMRFGDTGDDQGVDVVVDAAGSVVMTGYFTSSVELGGATLFSAGGRDIFVAKYSTLGTHMWSTSYGSSFGNDEGTSVAVDGSGNIILAGRFGNSVNFGGGSLTSAGNADVFVAKYNTFGTHLWSNSYGGSDWDFPKGLATNQATDDVVITGYFGGSANFGGANLVSAGDDDIFVAAYNQGGAHLWSKRFGDTGVDTGGGVAVDAAGNVVLTGAFIGTVNFGGGSVSDIGGTTSFLATYNSGGTHQWSRIAGQSHGTGVAVNDDGDILVTGLLLGTGDFGGGDLVSAGGFDVFIAWYQNDGTHEWSRRYGDAGNEAGFAIAVDATGNVTITGESDGTINFGGYDLGGAGSFDIFVAKFFGEIEIGPLDDCGNDRGRCAAMVWVKHVLDGPPIPVDPPWPPVTRYSIWRAVGTLPMYPPDPVHSCPTAVTSPAGRAAMPCDGWERVAVVVATAKELYNVDVPTTKDVSPGDPAVHYFVILAEDDTGGWHTSDPESVTTTNELGSTITSIVDVPNDNGRRVSITFSRDSEDTAGAATPILSYEIYREDDAPAAMTTSAKHDEPDDPSRIEGWTYVASAPAHGDPGYTVEAPTIGDSTISQGDYLSTFFVRATTSAPTTFYDSSPALGYSLDNLAPGAPAGLVNTSGVLSWYPSSASDFDYFTVYGANFYDFGAATVIDYATGESMDISSSPYVYYFVTATDESGNEGPPAALDTPSGADGVPERYVLSLTNYPNPFNPATTIRYTVAAPGPVSIAVYDVRGVRVATIVDNVSRNAGGYQVAWDGRDDGGLLVASGVYFARINSIGGVRTRKMILMK